MDDPDNNRSTPTPYQPDSPGVTPDNQASLSENPVSGYHTDPNPLVEARPPVPVPYFAARTDTTNSTTPSDAGATRPSAPKKKILLWAVLATVVVILGVGTALAYNLWYQNPQKVVTDSIINAVHAKTVSYTGSFTMTGDTKANLLFNGNAVAGTGSLNAAVTFDIANKPYTLNASGLMNDKHDVYLKIKNIKSLSDSYRQQLPPASQPTFDKIIATIEDKWIKMSADDVASYSASASKAQTCLSDTVKKFQDDKNASNEIATIYQNHQFIKIDKKLGSKGGSLGYSLSSDDTAAVAFARDFKNTQLYKSLHNCDSSFTINDKDLTGSSTNNGQAPHVELWVSRWSHQITKLLVTDASGSSSQTKTSFVIQPVFNGKVTVTTPTNATTLKQLTQDIQTLFLSLYMTNM
ncbi:MAG: hypothetical protein ACHQTE_00950 [Candidatus Saccharimonadales bacterium]